MGSPLVAFALVADEYEKSGDPILGLRPLFAPLLHENAGHAFDANAFSQSFKDNYGLDMTAFVADALKDVLYRMGLLTRVDGGAFCVADFDWSPDSIDEPEIAKTLDLFARWAKEKLRLTTWHFDDKKLEDAILSRLARPEFSSIFTDGDPIKKQKGLRVY